MGQVGLNIDLNGPEMVQAISQASYLLPLAHNKQSGRAKPSFIDCLNPNRSAALRIEMCIEGTCRRSVKV